MTVVSLVVRSLAADGDGLLCNWDFKSICSARVTFQCLSPPAWQELMTANNAIFKVSHLQPSKCEYSIEYIMWKDSALFLFLLYYSGNISSAFSPQCISRTSQSSRDMLCTFI